MKFKRILAGGLSALTLTSAFVFTANAENDIQETPNTVAKLYRTLNAKDGVGFTGEAMTRTLEYDSKNDYVYAHFVPQEKHDCMHLGWHGADNFTWQLPMTVGFLMRTNTSANVSVRFDDRTPVRDGIGNLQYTGKSAATTADGNWEVVYIEASDFTQKDSATVTAADFDALTHIQAFLVGENKYGDDNKNSSIYVDVAGYAFFNKYASELSDDDLLAAINASGKITLTFDTQNGDQPTTAQVVSSQYGDASAKVEFPESSTFTAPQNKVFKGWATSKDATEVLSENVAVPQENTTYYAIWENAPDQPGDVTIKSLTLFGTDSDKFSKAFDADNNTYTLTVPTNWKGAMVPQIAVVTTDSGANVQYDQGTFESGSTITVKNGSSEVAYKVEYVQNAAKTLTATPTGLITSNTSNGKVTLDGEEYTFKSKAASAGRVQTKQEIAGTTGTKIYYNTEYSQNVTERNDEEKTVKSVSEFTIASGSYTGFEGYGAFGNVTLSDYPWARIKYYIDPGKDNTTYERKFNFGTTASTPAKGYAKSSKQNQQLNSQDNMVAGRWAYAYINLADTFAQDYGYTIQFHFRPFGQITSNKIMKVSADDPTKAVPTANPEAVLFDDSFYLASVELFNAFPEENNEYAQIAPWEGLFTATSESAVNANDGTISGLNTDMEYKLSTSDTWIKAEASEVSNLAPGTYQIRYAAKEAANNYKWSASPAVEVKVESALLAKPEVVAVNATGVGKNDGKITGVTSNMEYQLVGAESWTDVESDGEIANLAPGKYQIRYKADTTRPEASEATQVTVLVNFNTDVVFYVTGNNAYSDKANDGSSYEKPYYVNHNEHMTAVVNKYLAKEDVKTLTMVVIDGIYLGGWNENYNTGKGKQLTITGLTPNAFIDFSCHTEKGNNTMQGFGNVEKLTIENITLCKTCRGNKVAEGTTCTGISGDCGIAIGGSTEIIISNTVIAGTNASRIMIYSPTGSVNNKIQIDGGTFRQVHAGSSFGMSSRTQGSQNIVVNGGTVGTVSATRFSQIYLGNYNITVNKGNVTAIIAGSNYGAFAGDSHIEINGGTVGTVTTTAKAERHGSAGAYTDAGIKKGSSVVIINDGTVNAFAKGTVAPGGSALVISKKATVPTLSGNEADYVIVVPADTKISAVLETEDYKYTVTKQITANKEAPNFKDDKDFNYSNDGGDLEYKASTIKGFTITSDTYNTAYVGNKTYSFSNGSVTIPCTDLSTEAVNDITLGNTAKVTFELNGGLAVEDNTVSLEYGEDFYFDVSGAGIKPYRSGYELLGWTSTPQNDFAPKADISNIEYASDIKGIQNDVTVYAVWQQADAPFSNDLIKNEQLEEYQYIKFTKHNDLQHPDITPDSKLTVLGTVTPLGCFRAEVVDAKTDTVVRTLDPTEAIDFNYFTNNQETTLAELKISNNNIAVQDYEGWYQFFKIEPQSEYVLKGTYYAKRGEYVVDLYYKGVAVNAGSFGMKYGDMDYVDIIPSENVKFFTDENKIHSADDNSIVFTWNANIENSTAIGGNNAGEVLIATATFKMTEQQRENCINNNNLVGVYALPDERADETVYSDPYYLVVSDNKQDKYEVAYHPAYCGDIIDEIANEAMVNVTGTVVMSARNDGTAVISADNYAKVYWKHKGASTWNKVEIEDENTTAKNVNFTIQNVPANVEIEIKVVKNGYITKNITNLKFNQAADDETEVPARAIEENIVLVPGDIKGSYNDECGDGTVNIADFVRVIRGFDNDAKNDEKFTAAVDINEDGVVSVADLSIVKSNFGAKAE